MEKHDLEGVAVLVVEDDPGILMLLRTFLVARGAIVMTEQDGRNVLTRINSKLPDLVILDVVMPYMDGLTVLAAIRQTKLSVPVILLTDQNSIDDKVEGLGLGADDYVTKPFSTRELLARVKSLLRRTGSSDNHANMETIVVGTLEVRVAAREIVLSGGQLFHLTKTEFDLFCFLARRKDKVVSHSSLLREVMGYKSDIETKALVMHIANMRRKFLKANLTDLKIETVAGVGYKLVAG